MTRVNLEDCPDVKKHTKSPDDYGGFFTWAEEKSKTHADILLRIANE